MVIFQGINGNPCGLSIHMNKYLPSHTIQLHYYDWDSACNEADDVYRGLLTEAVNYLAEQVKLLPDI